MTEKNCHVEGVVLRDDAFPPGLSEPVTDVEREVVAIIEDINKSRAVFHRKLEAWNWADREMSKDAARGRVERYSEDWFTGFVREYNSQMEGEEST